METKVLVGVPCQSEYTHNMFWESLLNLDRDYVLDFDIQERQLPDIARTNIAKNAIKKGASHILFIDNDMTFESKLLKELLRYDKQIVGALTWQRRPPFYLSVYRHNPKESSLKGDFDPILYPEVQLKLINENNNTKFGELWEVDAVGMAATLIRTEVFENTIPPYFKFEREGGEDLSFCKRVKEDGVRVYCDTSVRVGHITNRVIDFKDLKTYTSYAKFINKWQKENE